MPIEEVVSEPNDTISLACKRLKREEFWYCELCTTYPYGLSDNVTGFGNVSSKKDKELVVYGLFNKTRRKFRKRKPHGHRKEIGSRRVEEELTENLVVDYKIPSVTFRLKSYIMRYT